MKSLLYFRDGRFITDKYVYANEVCYDTTTGEESMLDSIWLGCEPYMDRSTTELEYSDMIINGDLLRFKEEEEDYRKLVKLK